MFADIFNSYFTKIGLDTVSHLQPTLATGLVLMVVKVIFFGGDQTAYVVSILQQLTKTLSKNTFLS